MIGRLGLKYDLEYREAAEAAKCYGKICAALKTPVSVKSLREGLYFLANHVSMPLRKELYENLKELTKSKSGVVKRTIEDYTSNF